MTTQVINVESAYNKALMLYFDFPTLDFTLNNLIKPLKISKTTANLTISRLVKEKFLELKIIGKMWRITCNQTHKYNTYKKIPYHLNLIYESGIIEEIRKKYQSAKAIILFGSYRKGDDNEKSDIDIAVEITGEKFNLVEFKKIDIGYRRGENKVQVNLHIFSRKSINLNLFSNIANGIVLDGFLEVNP